MSVGEGTSFRPCVCRILICECLNKCLYEAVRLFWLICDWQEVGLPLNISRGRMVVNETLHEC